VTIQVKDDDGTIIATLTSDQERAFHKMAAMEDARQNARTFKAAMTRLANEQRDFSRWDKSYQTERRRRIRKVQKLEATVVRLSGGKANGGA
jgi:hypothetical protein